MKLKGKKVPGRAFLAFLGGVAFTPLEARLFIRVDCPDEHRERKETERESFLSLLCPD